MGELALCVPLIFLLIFFNTNQQNVLIGETYPLLKKNEVYANKCVSQWREFKKICI